MFFHGVFAVRGYRKTDWKNDGFLSFFMEVVKWQMTETQRKDKIKIHKHISQSEKQEDNP